MSWAYEYRRPLATGTVAVNAVSKSLKTMGFVIPNGTTCLTVQNLDSTNAVEINDGAVTSGAAFRLGGYESKSFLWQTSELKGLEFLSSSGANMFIMCEGPKSGA